MEIPAIRYNALASDQLVPATLLPQQRDRPAKTPRPLIGGWKLPLNHEKHAFDLLLTLCLFLDTLSGITFPEQRSPFCVIGWK